MMLYCIGIKQGITMKLKLIENAKNLHYLKHNNRNIDLYMNSEKDMKRAVFCFMIRWCICTFQL
jgi:hypothetical protein